MSTLVISFVNKYFSSVLCWWVSVFRLIWSETSASCTPLFCHWLALLLQQVVKGDHKCIGTCEPSGLSCSWYMCMIETKILNWNSVYFGGQRGKHCKKVTFLEQPVYEFPLFTLFPKSCDLFPCLNSFSCYAFFPFLTTKLCLTSSRGLSWWRQEKLFWEA